MSELLSRYQVAVLQEMGITVWEKRDASSSPHSQPRAEPKSSPASNHEKLAQLRSTIAPKARDEASSKPKLLQQLPDNNPLIKDIIEALVQTVPTADGQKFSFYLSNTLKVTGDKVLLPVMPEQLQPVQKKALWEDICKLSLPHAH